MNNYHWEDNSVKKISELIWNWKVGIFVELTEGGRFLGLWLVSLAYSANYNSIRGTVSNKKWFIPEEWHLGLSFDTCVNIHTHSSQENYISIPHSACSWALRNF